MWNLAYVCISTKYLVRQTIGPMPSINSNGNEYDFSSKTLIKSNFCRGESMVKWKKN